MRAAAKTLPSNITIATTGASGAEFLRQMLRLLEADARVTTVNFIASDNALRVMAEELEIRPKNRLVEQLLGKTSRKVRQQNNSDIGANVASGSYPAEAMVVIPCSAGTLGRVANGTGSQLIERAADVCLKEGRPLVLCVRETPFNKVVLRNLWRAAEAGAVIFPLIPSFSNRPRTVEEMAREFGHRVLARIGLPQAQAFRWQGGPAGQGK